MTDYPKQQVELPTVGRIVYFYSYQGMTRTYDRPRAAIVADAGSGFQIDLMVIDHDGSNSSAHNVPHKDDSYLGRPYWDWMPYQKGQAAKTAQIQAQLDEKWGAS